MVKRFTKLPKDGRFVFRKMEAEGEHPVLGRTNYRLGVRINAGDLSDITIDDLGQVNYGFEGMSVTPDDPMRLQPYRRPPEWGGNARRPYPIWCISLGDLGNDLAYQADERTPRSTVSSSRPKQWRLSGTKKR